jgi:hypothetical protein
LFIPIKSIILFLSLFPFGILIFLSFPGLVVDGVDVLLGAFLLSKVLINNVLFF